jgi:hypothetical protein
MRMVIISFVFLVLPSSTEIALSETKPALELVLAPGDVDVVSGQKFTLNLKVTNTSKVDVSCVFIDGGDVNLLYTYDVRKEDGESLRQVHRTVNIVRNGSCHVKPGETFDETISSLMSAYGMQEPGVYTVQVSRPDPSDPNLDRSNTIKVIVTAPQ